MTPSVTGMTYNGLGNRTSVISDDAGAWSYTYTENGLVKTATDGRGIGLKNGYDRIGRL